MSKIVPYVSVPVLSNITADTLYAISRTPPPLIKTPLVAPIPVPTMIAVGVAFSLGNNGRRDTSPRAHGQAITITEIANKRATRKEFFPLLL